MTMLDTCETDPIQSRTIEIESHECDDTHIVVCGRLRDRRLVPTFTVEGKPRAAATVHHLRICMKVETTTLAIEAIEAELPAVPHAECAQLQRSVEAVRGMVLAPGFTAQVKKKLGGRNGCIHLTTLLLAMAPAALQGYWVHNDRVPERRRVSGDRMERYLIDTCRVWRREGALAEKVARALGVELGREGSAADP